MDQENELNNSNLMSTIRRLISVCPNMLNVKLNVVNRFYGLLELSYWLLTIPPCFQLWYRLNSIYLKNLVICTLSCDGKDWWWVIWFVNVLILKVRKTQISGCFKTRFLNLVLKPNYWYFFVCIHRWKLMNSYVYELNLLHFIVLHLYVG